MTGVCKYNIGPIGNRRADIRCQRVMLNYPGNLMIGCIGLGIGLDIWLG